MAPYVNNNLTYKEVMFISNLWHVYLKYLEVKKYRLQTGAHAASKTSSLWDATTQLNYYMLG